MDSENKDREERKAPSTAHILRNVFGIFMVLVYVGMGVLMFMNFFHLIPWVTYTIGTLLVLYGIWRGYRQAKGLDNPYE